MQKRQLRLNNLLQIRERLAEFLHKKINIVLKDGRVMVGVLLEIKGEQIIFKNMRLSRHNLPVADIYEIQLELDA